MARLVVGVVFSALPTLFAASVSFAQVEYAGDLPFGLGVGQVNWQADATNLSKSDLLEALGELGFTIPGEQLAEIEYADLFSRVVIPGSKEFLVIPDAGEPFTLSPLSSLNEALSLYRFGENNDVDPVRWSIQPFRVAPEVTGQEAFFGKSADEIRQDLMDGLMATVQDLCQLPARPQSIEVTASAVGVLEMKAVWVSSEVCDKLSEAE